MEFRTLTGVLVKGGHPEDYMLFGGTLGEQVCPASATEFTHLSWRGLVGAEQILSARDPEMGSKHTSGRRVGAGMRFSAGHTVTMLNWHVELINFVGDLPA
jgi:hypothetical protein